MMATFPLRECVAKLRDAWSDVGGVAEGPGACPRAATLVPVVRLVTASQALDLAGCDGRGAARHGDDPVGRGQMLRPVA
jgi:hypothetical protein